MIIPNNTFNTKNKDLSKINYLLSTKNLRRCIISIHKHPDFDQNPAYLKRTNMFITHQHIYSQNIKLSIYLFLRYQSSIFIGKHFHAIYSFHSGLFYSQNIHQIWRLRAPYALWQPWCVCIERYTIFTCVCLNFPGIVSWWALGFVVAPNEGRAGGDGVMGGGCCNKNSRCCKMQAIIQSNFVVFLKMLRTLFLFFLN